MVPPKGVAYTSEMKKKHSNSVAMSVQEEALSVEKPINFPRLYVPLRKPIVKQVIP
jgi:hypothetical protein